ncbi:lysine exporter LysO family protein [Neisseria leonii]|uniref:lysine exporter LysO family protein n=1 Tax=Neisseria leonii TaxID=2995413 RepID=UPI00237BA6FA|nr:lysine exporter LysO family protein [Neisseria sp. 3986]MDD9324893.1 lysine exporter LysO family protein [Neisseria sp. 3986]
MNNLLTLTGILAPLFFGFFIRLPKACLPALDKLLGITVYLLLALIGLSLSRIPDLGRQLGFVAHSAALLAVCIIGANLLAVMWFDRRCPMPDRQPNRHTGGRVGSTGSLKQLLCVALGLGAGKLLPDTLLPPESAATYALMLLILLVGIQLGGSGITLRQVLINRRGVQTALLITASSLAGGLLFAAVSGIPPAQGLALASGFGWYSLSGIMMSNAYGALWGSIALLNDLARELAALILIPPLMRRHPSAAVGIGGATSLDFTLPVIRSSGGTAVVPLAISCGFLLNLIPPLLMAVFPTFSR